MIKNYFKIALRNLVKRKGYSFINIFGLATGMAVCLLIVLYVQSELSYDEHHEKADDIYRVALHRTYPGRTTSYSIIPPTLNMRTLSFTSGNSVFSAPANDGGMME